MASLSQALKRLETAVNTLDHNMNIVQHALDTGAASKSSGNDNFDRKKAVQKIDQTIDMIEMLLEKDEAQGGKL